MMGGRLGSPASAGRRAPEDQRSLGRRYVERNAGFSPGFSDQTDERAWLKYLADMGSGTQRGGGFLGVRRR